MWIFRLVLDESTSYSIPMVTLFLLASIHFLVVIHSNRCESNRKIEHIEKELYSMCVHIVHIAEYLLIYK